MANLQEKDIQKLAAYTELQDKKNTIDEFVGHFDFLDNDYPALVYYENIMYPSVNAAFQAARTNQVFIREKLARIDTPNELWSIAADIEDPPNWEAERLRIMELLLRDKFRRNKEFREKLAYTQQMKIVYKVTDSIPSNLYWGQHKNRG